MSTSTALASSLSLGAAGTLLYNQGVVRHAASTVATPLPTACGQHGGGGHRGEWCSNSDGLGEPVMGSAGFFFKFFYLIEASNKTASENRSFIMTFALRRLGLPASVNSF